MAQPPPHPGSPADRTAASPDTAGASHAVPVTMLLLGDPTGDARVIKAARSLQRAGYAVSLYCLAERPGARPLPDLAGAAVHWVRAPRPLAWLLARVPRKGTARGAPTEPELAVARQSVPAALRAWLGTLWLNLALVRVARRRPAAIVHANDLDTLLAGMLLRRLLGAALVYDSHELYPDMFSTSPPLYVGLWRLLERRLIGGAAAVITVNQSIAAELQRRHRLPAVPAVVMNCPPVTDAPVAATPGPDEEVRLVFHGRYQAERGLETVIAAMAEIDRRAVLHLRGSGPLRPYLERLAAVHGVGDRVRFLDPVSPDRLVAGLDGASIGLVPYLPTSLNNRYCTPNKLFEFLMAGLAVVASDLPELRRAVAGADAGTLYPAADMRALADAVNALLADPERLARCRVAARQAAMDRYNWEAQEEELLRIYAELDGLGRRAASSPA